VRYISEELVIGIDLGGSAIRAGSVTKEGRLYHFRDFSIPEDRKKDLVLTSIIDLINDIITLEGGRGDKVIGIGIGSPGIIRIERGVIMRSPNFPGWKDVPLRSHIERAIHLPVVLDNDANAAAFGEKWKGAGQKVESLICMTLGTGIGGGIIIDGKVWHGALGMAGEIGHITVNPDGRRCNCGNYGCLEAYSSASGMVKGAIAAIEEGKKTTLKRLSQGDNDRITGRMLYEAAVGGDRLAIHIFKEAGRYLGIAMAGLIHILNPEMIVLTGGVTESWDLFMPVAMDEIKRRVYRQTIEKTKIRRGRLPGTAGVIGAAGLAWRSFQKG